MNHNLQRLVTSILKQRKYLISASMSGKNTQLCLKYINEISIQIEAHKSKWNEEGWKKFIERNIDKLEYLVPENKAGQTIKQKLYAVK
jgi:hypothetical protein